MSRAPRADRRSPEAPVANAAFGRQPAPPRPVRPLAAPARTLHMVGNAHLDPVWLWPWQEGYQEARATFWSAIHRMDEYPDFVFTCDQVVLLSWVEESDPELFERIRRRVAEGRWQMVGGWWVEPDCNLPMGESFVRQGLYGQRYLKEKLGVIATVGMNADPFGHNGMLPQILRGQGMDSYCFLRPGPHENSLDATAFWWESPDGSRVLGYRIPFEYCSAPGDVAGQADKALGTLDRDLGDVMVFYGVGNHGGGPTRANIDSIHRYDRMGTFGAMTMSSPRRYFDELAARLGADGLEDLPVWRTDLQLHAAGCYSAHSGIKLWQRRAQAAVLNAERWAAVGALAFGLDYPREDLGRAWKQILFNQFHDVLPGSAIEPAYEDARDQLGEAVAISKRIITRTHNVIARQVEIPLEDGTQPVLVFNPHPWRVVTAVELQYGSQPQGIHVVDGDGGLVLSQRVQSVATTNDQGRHATVLEADVPPLGFRLYRLRPGAAPWGAVRTGRPPGVLRASETVLENDLLRVEVDPGTGWLTSLLDKRSGVDLLAGAAGPHTQVCQDPTDTWGHHVVSYAWPGDEMRTVRVLLRESGPLRARLRVEREWGRSTMVEELVLGHADDYLEVQVTIDWREQAHLLKMRFPVGITDPTATYEIPFGSTTRPVDAGEHPGQSWVDVTGEVQGRRAGLAVVNDAKHGYDVSPASAEASASIGITALRSPVYSWHDPRALDPDGIYSFQDQGIQRFRYRLVPHDGDWRTAGLSRRAAELGSPVRAMLESFHPGPLPDRQSYASDGGGAVMVTAVKGSEDVPDGAAADLVVRAVETTGSPTRARIELPLVGRVVEADLGPSQIRTFRLPADGGPMVEVDLVEWPLAETPAAPADVLPLAPAVEGVESTGPTPDDSDAPNPAELEARDAEGRDGS
ncbi:MAG: alpha-mannosidase [Cellulomonas sp. 73-145]|uniref:alpha-mannosidase n=1 Tax=Cellulomonas sp. 73-145 TaxID=1895739 RepID=UPI000925C8E1|nr:alpha-mannosidase [Cellulomonas sp. 73-145]MBN9328504.1 alpha-mannosidase [Cellulomonas sp.]OJV59629.1 MAG: alpha-mannosidase [Cellulomonas sp. 73-145]